METLRQGYIELEYTLTNMDDIKRNEIFYPETIDENPFPIAEGMVDFGATQQTSKGEYEPQKIKPQPLPTRKVAHEVLGRALNTRSQRILADFKFTATGAISIGTYTNGVSGDVRISPNGIVARNSAGTTTFALDGTTGNAVFKGEIQAGALISGLVAVGDNAVVIDGENRRMVFFDESGVARIVIGEV